MDDEVCELTETEVMLYYLSNMIDTILEQLEWMRELIDEELGKEDIKREV